MDRPFFNHDSQPPPPPPLTVTVTDTDNNTPLPPLGPTPPQSQAQPQSQPQPQAQPQPLPQANPGSTSASLALALPGPPPPPPTAIPTTNATGTNPSYADFSGAAAENVTVIMNQTNQAEVAVALAVAPVNAPAPVTAADPAPTVSAAPTVAAAAPVAATIGEEHVGVGPNQPWTPWGRQPTNPNPLSFQASHPLNAAPVFAHAPATVAESANANATATVADLGVMPEMQQVQLQVQASTLETHVPVAVPLPVPVRVPEDVPAPVPVHEHVPAPVHVHVPAPVIPKKVSAAEAALRAVQQFRNKSAAVAVAPVPVPTPVVESVIGTAIAATTNAEAPTAMEIDVHTHAHAPMEAEAASMPLINANVNVNATTGLALGLALGLADNESGMKQPFSAAAAAEASKERFINKNAENKYDNLGMRYENEEMHGPGTGTGTGPLDEYNTLGNSSSTFGQGQGQAQQQTPSSILRVKLPNHKPPPMEEQPFPPRPAPGGFGALRELKVEDALNYLDQVKLEFGDRPRIYNEFLEIMKNFKAHEIDTPGVIMRVSDLFRGYNNLILGFNTFLPDGFKISIMDLVEGGRYASKKPLPQGHPGSDGGGNGGNGNPMIDPMQQMASGTPLSPLSVARGRQQGGAHVVGSARPTQNQGQGQLPGMQSMPPRNMSFRLPNHGHPPPRGRMGRGHPMPMMRPNQNPMQQQQPQVQQPQVQQPPPGLPGPGPNQNQQMAMMQALPPPHPPQQEREREQQQQQQREHLQREREREQHQQRERDQQNQLQQQQQQQQQQQDEDSQNPAIEFDHAITYVTTIKKRFANEPRTYQQFLEILHTYQKEQRGIREVLEQVSSLFADHPDLLKQFTYFLPEAVQEQAKERLHAAAAEAEARQAAARQRAMDAPVHYQPVHGLHPGHEVVHDDDDDEVMEGDDAEIALDMTERQHSRDDARVMQTSPGSRKRPSSPSNVTTLQYPMMPETVTYNAGVERQFFDMTKEALRSTSRDGEMAWVEFLKCMDLYAQEILTKNDMLRYMEDLLGKQHADLLEEFKRILVAAGAAGAPSHDDAWHSVPLSEIDFRRCRRCTPSYRALPRDYPVAPFSGRSEEEAKLLNDVWISLPDGSEESYTFRHMRKNQHEEVLFRCEDERFEIDMVIDSTATALKRLEPIAEEIAMLQQKEILAGKANGTEGKDKSGTKAALEKGGIAGKIVQYSFDKSILNTIHRHAIARIYGDAGQEMLELMNKNPVVAVPVVVKRLKQKDRDFRAAREVLNRRWKELAEVNYYKSIDHRSLTWRTIDKRATSTRTLAAEIKDRAANNGAESDVAVVAKKDKAKEEFGSFYEKTMGRYLARQMDLTNLPKPATSVFGSTPHYSMQYKSSSWAQRDAYRILSFALERGSTSPGDKERCHRFWTDFLAPFFDLGSIWMQSPAVAYAALPHHNTPSIVSNGEESGIDDDESSAEEKDMIGDMVVTEEVMKDCSTSGKGSVTGFSLLDNQPIPSGASVSTIYGDGTVIRYRSFDKSYVVSLPFGGTSYLNRNAVLCTILPVDQFLELEDQPMPSKDDEPLGRDDDKFVLGPQCLYLFFRLHQLLIRRLNIARQLAFSVDTDQSLSTLIEHMTADGSAPVGQKRYDAYLSLVYGLLEGGYNSTFQGGSASAAEGGKYEDRVRCLLGHGAYELATMDKLVSHILKHLQNLANDDTMQGMIQIFKKQMDSGSFKPLAFRQEAAMISEGENVFAFQYCKISKSDNAIMHVQFVGCITDDEDDDSDKGSMASLAESNDGPVAKKLKR